MAAKPELAQQGLLPGLVAAEAVEDYVSLQAQVKELETQLEEIKQTIIDFCQAEGLNRVFGREYAITCRLVEKAGFSEDEVRVLLEPEGLWDRVLSFDQSKLKQLVTDEGVAEDIREKLKALRQVISSSPRLWVRRLIEEE